MFSGKIHQKVVIKRYFFPTEQCLEGNTVISGQVVHMLILFAWDFPTLMRINGTFRRVLQHCKAGRKSRNLPLFPSIVLIIVKKKNTGKQKLRIAKPWWRYVPSSTQYLRQFSNENQLSFKKLLSLLPSSWQTLVKTGQMQAKSSKVPPNPSVGLSLQTR